MSRTYKDRHCYKGFLTGDFKHYHHGVLIRSYFKNRRAWFFKAPAWCTNLYVVRPERQDTRIKIVNVLKIGVRPKDEDVPMFAKGNKPNADWKWT